MTVLHCTRKLAEKLSEVSAAPIEEAGALGSWHATLVRFDRLQCVLFCHDDTPKTDRSVLGTMNIALDDLQAYVEDAAHILAVDPLLVSRRLNNRPVMANGKPLWPGKAMRARVTRLSR